ncbi:MAG: HAD family phosphatase [Flavobacteriaceae bacterium]|nr:HAD family phosphatase [Flavobacteriaceae bacterium]
MKNIQCVIFDMDGVIVNTEPLHKKAYYQLFDSLKINVTPTLYHSFTGGSTINICQKLVDTFNLNENPQDLVLRKRSNFVKLFTNDPTLQLIEGVEDIIKYFYNKQITLVLASSASMETINRVFTRFDLDKYFIGKLSGADLQQSKPHPEIFEKAAALANTPKENCIVIEDSDKGVKASNRAEIYCVGYISKHSKLQKLEHADMVISDFSNLKKYI